MPEVGISALYPVPVILIVFNRPATTRRVFDRVVEARPAKLLIVADGPRSERPGEEELCREVREIVSAVDWPCEVLRNFAPNNVGCRERIVTGLDWAFSIVEEAVILEDDCLPDASFFPFCHELLDRYRGDSRIAAIAGTNLVAQHMNMPYDYYFSRLGGIWGWATWRSQWQGYDRYLKSWPDIRRVKALSELFGRPKDIAYWSRIFNSMFEGRGPDTWDYQWVYTNLFGNRLTVVPRLNLIANIGFGAGATHTSSTETRPIPKPESITFPLRHPAAIIPSSSLDRHFQKLYERPNRRVVLRMGQAIARLCRSCRERTLHSGGRRLAPEGTQTCISAPEDR